MNRNIVTIIYALLMVSVIIAADIIFFRHRTRERLIANIAIVLIFSLTYAAWKAHR
jgi:hypothetical protein